MTALKERPVCRRVILREGLRPGVVFDTDSGARVRPLRAGEEWDHVTAMRLGDDRPVGLTDGIRKQMRKMLAEGWQQEMEVLTR